MIHLTKNLARRLRVRVPGRRGTLVKAVLISLWLMVDVTAWGLIFYEHERLIQTASDVGVLYMHLPIHKRQRYGGGR